MSVIEEFFFNIITILLILLIGIFIILIFAKTQRTRYLALLIAALVAIAVFALTGVHIYAAIAYVFTGIIAALVLNEYVEEY